MLIALALLLLLAGLATAALVLHRRGVWRLPPLRRASMEEAWAAWLVGGDAVRREELLAQMNPEVRESVRSNLLEFEAALRREAAPLAALRLELMDSVDRRLLNQEILQLPPEVRRKLRSQSVDLLQSDEEARTYIAANEVRMAVMREYAARRFGDRTEGDWFEVYEKASRLKQRGARNFIQRTLNGTQTGADDARYQNMTRVDQEIRARLLKVPAGTRFQGFSADKPTGD